MQGMFPVLTPTFVPDIVGGTSESIFTRAERLLMEGDDYQEALEFVASRKSMARYRSMMDFLLCELFTEYRPGCFLFYDEKGPPLREILSPAQVARLDLALVMALDLAKHLLRKKRHLIWARYASALKAAARDKLGYGK